jgi:hypothetical protein
MKRKALIAFAVLLVLAASAGASWVDTLVERMMETIIPWFAKLILYPPMAGLLWALKGILYFNPTVFCYSPSGCKLTPGVDALYPFMMDILIPVYIIAIMFNALFFIAKAGNPAGRARARRMFYRLIMGMLFVIYAPLLYQGMIDVSSTITTYYLNDISISKVMYLMSFGKAAALCSLLCCMLVIVLVTIIILLVRWFYVYIYGIFFPLIMFLYFFEITKPYGNKYLKQSIRWIFVPALQAFILYILVNGPLDAMAKVKITGLSDVLLILFSQTIGIFVVLAGLITMCAAPMIMTQILELVGTAVYSFGLSVDYLPLMSLGGIIAGQGPSAFSNAHGHFSRLRAYDSFRSAVGGESMSKEAPSAMRMMGSERGAIEGHGGGGGEAGGGGGEAGGGGVGMGDYFGEGAGGRGGAGGTLEETAAARRGTPSMGGALDAARRQGRASEQGGIGGVKKKDKGKIIHEGGEEPQGIPNKSDLDTEREGAAKSTGGRVEGELAVARREIEEGTATGFTPGDLVEERGKGGEGVYDLLGGSGVTFESFAHASTRNQNSTIQQTDNAINALENAGMTSDLLNPFRNMSKDMKSIAKTTTRFKRPDEIKEADTRLQADMIERQKSLENNASIAREKLALIQKQAGEKTALQKEIAHLQNLLKSGKEQEGKGSNPLAPKK